VNRACEPRVNCAVSGEDGQREEHQDGVSDLRALAGDVLRAKGGAGWDEAEAEASASSVLGGVGERLSSALLGADAESAVLLHVSVGMPGDEACRRSHISFGLHVGPRPLPPAASPGPVGVQTGRRTGVRVATFCVRLVVWTLRAAWRAERVWRGA
jgi:hypothetical protein